MQLRVGLCPGLVFPLVLGKVLLEALLELCLLVRGELLPGLGGALRARAERLAGDGVLLDVVL